MRTFKKKLMLIKLSREFNPAKTHSWSYCLEPGIYTMGGMLSFGSA
jgi:hypothetical protein